MVIPVALFYLFSVSVSTIHFIDGFVLIALLPFDILCFSEGTCFYTVEGGNEYMNINHITKNI